MTRDTILGIYVPAIFQTGGTSPSLAGFPIYHAYAVFDLVSLQVIDTSNAVTISLAP